MNACGRPASCRIVYAYGMSKPCSISAVARARPAAEVLPEFIGKNAAEELVRRGRGRPKKADRKVNQTLRLDQDVLDAFREEGSGWQARINQVLRENMPRRER